jgi:hypothetical protein
MRDLSATGPAAPGRKSLPPPTAPSPLPSAEAGKGNRLPARAQPPVPVQRSQRVQPPARAHRLAHAQPQVPVLHSVVRIAQMQNPGSAGAARLCAAGNSAKTIATGTAQHPIVALPATGLRSENSARLAPIDARTPKTAGAPPIDRAPPILRALKTVLRRTRNQRPQGHASATAVLPAPHPRALTRSSLQSPASPPPENPALEPAPVGPEPGNPSPENPAPVSPVPTAPFVRFGPENLPPVNPVGPRFEARIPPVPPNRKTNSANLPPPNQIRARIIVRKRTPNEPRPHHRHRRPRRRRQEHRRPSSRAALRSSQPRNRRYVPRLRPQSHHVRSGLRRRLRP